MKRAADARKHRGSVLVVDDNTDLRELIMAVLEAEGYDVSGAADGARALERLREEPRPDLVLLDLMMPVLDGWQFRKQQLADPAVAAIPVIVLSGDADADAHAVALRAAGSLRKPVDLERLLGTVARTLGAKRVA
jgi:CheY-like chemotaxis protein